ncbi:transcriptional regulator, AsnC family [butyrate-producing bacterium SM4/1]|nr:Lrp/AsnC family transcriptional regulator [Clostridium sp.]CBL35721.1 transcriptional regulator, AsnC family [butyrate-producing bacterium SM4/1]
MFLGNLDDTDQKIITLLTENARMSYSDIGVRVGLSRVAVKSRIQALEERGIIEEYTTIINPQKISGAVSCYFEMEFSPDGFSESCRKLKDCDTVTQIYQVSGRCRLHVHAVAASQEELESFLNETVLTLPGLSDLSCNIILSRIKDIKGLRL